MPETQNTPSKNVDAWQNFKRLMGFAKKYKAAGIFSIFAMLGYASIDIFFLSKLGQLIDEGLMGNNPTFMKWAPLFVIVCFTIRGIFHFLSNYCLSWVGHHVVTDLRQKLFEHVMSMPVAYHDKESTGTMISKITFDAEQIFEATSKSLLTLVQQGAFVIGLLGLMFWISWELSAIFLIITPIIALIATYVSKRFRKVSQNIQDAMGNVTTAAEQTFNGHKVVVTFDGQTREFERFAGINKQNRIQRMKMVATRSASVPIIQIIASFALAFILYLTSTDAIKDVSAGAFMSVVTYMTLLLRPLKMLTNVNGDFQKGMAACESIFNVLDQEKEKDTGTISIDRAKGNIEFKDVTFTYAGETSPTLKNVDLNVKPGETVALVGRSGSGKSTATSLLLRFYQATKGVVAIDGHDITEYKLKDIRKQFAYVSQQVVLFNDSIANNIAYGKPEASQEEIVEAAKKAHVWEFAKDMQDGLDTNIGDNGSMLSGGQRQRVAIARALLCDAPILILDEATSALDTESERHIQEALEVLQKDRTSIVIAHRLSTIESADNILVMDQGEIIESGNHQTLLDKNGAYAQLHNFQFGS